MTVKTRLVLILSVHTPHLRRFILLSNTLKYSIAADAASRMNSVFQLRQAILKRAFSGELVNQDPADEPASALLERIVAQRSDAAPAATSRRTRQSKA